jgi:DNA-directed RNA polymerase specialized sigma subunit
MTILTRQERERLVLDLYYNQGKTTHEIAEIERISICNICSITKEEETIPTEILDSCLFF